MGNPSPEYLRSLLGDLPADSPIAHEWQVFKRELPRLLEEGHAGRHVVIRGEESIGIWDSHEEALGEAAKRFGLGPYLVQPILYFQQPIRAGNVWRCQP